MDLVSQVSKVSSHFLVGSVLIRVSGRQWLRLWLPPQGRVLCPTAAERVRVLRTVTNLVSVHLRHQLVTLVKTFSFGLSLMNVSFFPEHLMKSCKSLKGGLQDVADELQVARIGPQHQAGSDSLLTASTFFKMRSRFFEDSIDSKYMGYLYGLGSTHHSSSSVSSSIIPAPSIIPPHLRERDAGTITPTLPLFPPTPSAAIPIQNPREREKREAAAAAAAAAAALLASSVESAKDPLTRASEKEARENGDGTSTEDSASPVMRSGSVAGER